MKFVSTAFLCLAAIGSAWAQPTVSGIVNAANYSKGIAQGSIFVVFGSGMGPAELVQVQSFPIPTALSNTAIKFTPIVGGPSFDALVVYTSAGQLAGILQSPAPVGDYNVTVTYNNVTSAPFRTSVVARNFGLISLASSGTGPAIAQIANLNSQINRFGAPARPGQTLVLYGIGLGPITAPDNNPPGLQDLKGPANLRVLVGDVEIEPLYAGRSPGIPGLDQINFVLPSNVPLGCTVPLRVRVAGQVTGSSTTLSIAPEGSAFCSHPLYSAESLRKLDQGSSFTAGSFTLTSQAIKLSVGGFSVTTTAENVGGAFSTVTLANIADVTNPGTAGLLLADNSCSVYDLIVDQNANVIGGTPQMLDAGTALTLNGPGVLNKSVPKPIASTSAYLASLGTGGTISTGTYRLAGTGGTQVGSFSADLRIPVPIIWTNQTALAAASLIRSSGVTLTWTGGDANDSVTIFGVSGVRFGATDDNPLFSTKTFICRAPATAGTFTVPASVISQLPASSGSILAGTGVSILALQQGTVSPQNGRFTAPLTAGGNIDLGIFTYGIGGLSLVNWQ